MEALNGKAMNHNAEGRMRTGLFMVVLCGPSCAQQVLVLFTNVGLFLCLVVEVAVPVAVLFCYLWQAIINEIEEKYPAKAG